jgi:phosphoribosylglycinamide formyltransferase-1
MKNIVLLASGSGTNAENIIQYFNDNEMAQVAAIYTNNPKAGVIDRARKHSVPCFHLTEEEMNSSNFIEKLKVKNTQLIVLAGFLIKVSPLLLEAFPQRIINLHPALLPDYGGKGMYGKHVHQAVIENEEEFSGITIHYVNEEYDEGEIIFQEEVEVDYEDTWQDLDYKVRQLEYKHYPEVIEYILKDL